MSGGAGAKIEKGIWRRQRGTYSVKVCVNHEYLRATFTTLAEARAWRDSMFASRIKREHRRPGSDLMLSAADTAVRRKVREHLKKAPRTTVIRDGQMFTLIRLPDVVTT